MKKLVLTIAVICLFWGMAGLAKAEPRSNPNTAIGEAIRLLEQKDYLAWYKNITPPERLEHLTDEVINSIAQAYGQNADDLLKVLKAIKNVKPETTGQNKIIYKVPQNLEDITNAVELNKINGLWYINFKYKK
jgi:hypothetical protein